MAQPSNPYSNLHFAGHVDWIHVNRLLLSKINSEAKARGEIVDIISGYRDEAYNKKVGGASDSQHTHGKAVDAYINGVPIGEVWSQKTFNRLGLRSGNQPNFFNGKPDPEHVDMGLGNDTGPVTSYASDQTGQSPDTSGQPSLSDQIAQETPDGSIGPVVGPNVIAANDATAPPQFVSGGLPPRFQTWQLLSQLPGASTDTMGLASLAGYENPDANN